MIILITLARDMWLISVGLTLMAVLLLLFFFWFLRRRENLYVSLVLAAIALDKLMAAIGIRFFVNGEALPDEFAWLRFTGTALILISIFFYGLHRFGFLNGILSKHE